MDEDSENAVENKLLAGEEISSSIAIVISILFETNLS